MNWMAERALRGESLAPGVLIVDWHVHLGRWIVMKTPADDGDEMVRLAKAAGVSKLVVNGTIWPDLRASNDMIAGFAARHPDTVVPFAVANPYQNDVAGEIRRCFEELGFRGVKLHAMHELIHSPRGISSYTREWDRLFAYLSEKSAPVLYHGVVTEEMIRDWPGVPFVQAHGIYSVANLERLARYPNFHVDTPSTQNKAWDVRAAVDVIGADRILWGTDAPYDDFAHRLGVVLDSGLAEGDIRKILGLNAARLLGMERRS